MGKHTGTHSVRKRLVEAGYDPTESEVREVTKRVKEYGAEKRRVTDQVITRFAEEVGVRSTEEVRI